MAAAIALQAKVGDNQVMPYGLSTHFSAADQRTFMDEMQSLGVKVLYPLAPAIPAPGSSDTAWNARHLDRAFASEAWWGWVKGNISIVSNHTALLGYYIWCIATDVCTNSTLRRSTLRMCCPRNPWLRVGCVLARSQRRLLPFRAQLPTNRQYFSFEQTVQRDQGY
jgi:hypothetical protein